MKKFLVKILLFALILFLIDKVFIVVVNRLPSLEVDRRLEKLINGEINANVYVMGSSRGARNVIPSQLQKGIQKSVFNLSYPGSNIDFHEYILNELLETNKKPEQILLVIDDYYELIDYPSLKFRYDRLNPLVAYPRIKNTLVKRGEKNGTLSNLMVLHLLNRRNFYLTPKSFTAHDSIFENGCMTVSFMSPKFDKKFNDQIDVNRYNIDEESPNLRAKFLSFINICVKNNIDLILCFPPNFKNNNLAFEKRIKELAGENARFMNFDIRNMEYKNYQNFNDESHMQKKGASIFTDDLILFLTQEASQ